MTCALVPYVTLTEAGAAFDVHNVNTRSGQNRTPEFLAVNPKHKVPVLIIDGEPLTENVAIQIWIARQFPKARLLPVEPHAEIRRFRSWPGSPRPYTCTSRPTRGRRILRSPRFGGSVKRVGNKLLFEGPGARRRAAGGARVVLRALLLRPTLISSGVGARFRSSSMSQGSRTAWRISRG
jgi:glutathione S-transferase